MLYSVISVDLMLLVCSGSACLVQSAARMLEVATGVGSAWSPIVQRTHTLLEHRNCCSAKLPFVDECLAA